METDETRTPKEPLSEAKLAAKNRANAQKSTGPSMQARQWTRLNALKHGLTSKFGWPGLDTPENRQFVRLGFWLLGPRNALEATYAENLVRCRLRQELFMAVEREVLMRKPGSRPQDDLRPYLFLEDKDALHTLDQLARHLTGITNAFEKEVLALLRVRQDNFPAGTSSGPAATGTAPFGNEAADEIEAQGFTGGPVLLPGSLERCLAQASRVLPDESVQEYQDLVRGLWASFAPASTLAGFLVDDFIQAQWRLERMLRIQGLVLERSAISTSGQNCGTSFAFVRDSQEHQALASLRLYESMLRKRMDKRMALLRRLRKQGWADCDLPKSVATSTPPGQPSSSPSTPGPGTSASSESGPQAVTPPPITINQTKDNAGKLASGDPPSNSSNANSAAEGDLVIDTNSSDKKNT